MLKPVPVPSDAPVVIMEFLGEPCQFSLNECLGILEVLSTLCSVALRKDELRATLSEGRPYELRLGETVLTVTPLH